MADDQTTAAPAPGIDYSALTPEIINGLIARATQPLPNIQPDQTPVDTSGFWGGLRHGISLLGEFAGSPGPEVLKTLSPAEREQAGFQALSRFGTGLMAASHYVPGQTFGSNLAQGFQAAEHGYDTTARQAAGLLGAQQDYAVKNQQADLAKLKEVIPLLQLQANQRAADAARTVMSGRKPGTPPPGTSIATGGSIGGPLLDALANIESGDQNIVSNVDKDSQGKTLAQGGNADEISQGHFQIQTATWRDFAKQAGVDVSQYPTAMSAPRDVQERVASVIPLKRFGPRTQELLRSRFGPLDTSQTVGALAGTPALTFAPGAAGPRIAAAPPPTAVAGAPAPPPQVGTQPPGTTVAMPPRVQTAGPGAASAPAPAAAPSGPAVEAPWLPGQVGPVTGPLAPAGQAAPTPATPPSVSPPPIVTPAPGAASQAPFNPADVAVRYGTLPPDLTARPTITPEEDADIQRQVAIAMPQLDAAKQLAEVVKQRRELISAKVEKQNTDVRAFRANEAKTQVDEAAKQAAEVRAAAQKQQDQAQQQANAVELERVKSGYTVDQQGALVALEGDKDRMKKSGEAAAAMLPVSEQLRQLPAIMRQLPPGGAISSLIGQYPLLTAALEQAHIVSPGTADNVSVFTGLTNHLATQLRVSGTGSMSDRDLDTFKSALPRMLQSDAGKAQAVAFLQNIADRVVQGQEFTQEYFSRIDPATGKPAHNLRHLNDALNAPRKLDANGINQGGLGPVLPAAPRFDGPNGYAAAQTWLRENVQSGHPYTAWLPDENGRVTQQILVRE